MPTNVYGPGDNYHPENSHVAAALIRRFHEAKQSGSNRARLDIVPSGQLMKRSTGWRRQFQHKTRVIDIDLRSYFDNVRHDRLLAKVVRRVFPGTAGRLAFKRCLPG